ncbi:alkaline phosphatase D family protein [Streptomyces silvensis]|uniref:alkaline phosphatase D family protein n=1 Tax=Streptomyces silvensis TaxID=1765722 RepID=UPI00099EA166|nr:alkaline phosphatase D family protein [Streptomyces silvensis]
MSPAFPTSSGLDRRLFLQAAGVGVGALLAGAGLAGQAEATSGAPRLRDEPFRLGVASGEPAADGCVLWTRLAPNPLAEDGHGGMPRASYGVQWQVAEDERFRRVVRSGAALALPELGHSVHPQVHGLRPGRQYFYRFRAQGHTSPAGRFRTTPHSRSRASFTFATASCQAWYHGHFSAYRDMVAKDPDVVFFLGDYLYEYGITAANMWRDAPLPGARHELETNTLADYRVRYSLFKTDPDLQAAHAAAPWILTPDDHEVQNDYADETSYYGLSEEDFLLRRAVAYRAYYENCPLPPLALAHGPDARLHRRLRYGGLATLHVLDGRQYRDAKPANTEEQNAPGRTMLGAGQERWLYRGLRTSDTRWNLLLQQVGLVKVTENRVDQWDGFPAARQRLLDVLGERGVAPSVVFTGDCHRSIAGDLLADFADPGSAVVSSEFLGTSIASDGDGAPTDNYTKDWMQHPWMKFYDGRRGYVLGHADADAITAEYRAVPYVRADNQAKGISLDRFRVEHGRTGMQKVS